METASYSKPAEGNHLLFPKHDFMSASDQFNNESSPIPSNTPVTYTAPALTERIYMHSQHLMRFLTSEYGISFQDSEDVMSRVYLKILNFDDEYSITFQNARQELSWIYRVIIRESMDLKRMREFFEIPEDFESQSSEAHLEGHIDLLDVEVLIDQLPEDLAGPLVEFLGGYSQQEVAEKFDISTAATKSRIHRAREFLRENSQL